MSGAQLQRAERSVTVGVGEVVTIGAKRLPDGRMLVEFEALVIRDGVVIARGPLYDVPVNAGRKLARALGALLSELGVAL